VARTEEPEERRHDREHDDGDRREDVPSAELTTHSDHRLGVRSLVR
jgi:hypothetical protein